MKKSKLFFVALLAITHSLHAVSREALNNKIEPDPSREFLDKKALCEEAIKNNDAETIRRIFCNKTTNYFVMPTKLQEEHECLQKTILLRAIYLLDGVSINQVFCTTPSLEVSSYILNKAIYLLDRKSINHVFQTTNHISIIEKILDSRREYLDPVSVRKAFEKSLLEHTRNIQELILKDAKDLLGAQFVGQLFENKEDSDLRVSILEHAKEWLDPAFVRQLFENKEDKYLRGSILEHAKEWLDSKFVRQLFENKEDKYLRGSILKHAKEWLDPKFVRELFETKEDNYLRGSILKHAKEWLDPAFVRQLFENKEDSDLRGSILEHAKEWLDSKFVRQLFETTEDKKEDNNLRDRILAHAKEWLDPKSIWKFYRNIENPIGHRSFIVKTLGDKKLFGMVVSKLSNLDENIQCFVIEKIQQKKGMHFQSIDDYIKDAIGKTKSKNEEKSIEMSRMIYQRVRGKNSFLIKNTYLIFEEQDVADLIFKTIFLSGAVAYDPGVIKMLENYCHNEEIQKNPKHKETPGEIFTNAPSKEMLQQLFEKINPVDNTISNKISNLSLDTVSEHQKFSLLDNYSLADMTESKKFFPGFAAMMDRLNTSHGDLIRSVKKTWEKSTTAQESNTEEVVVKKSPVFEESKEQLQRDNA